MKIHTGKILLLSFMSKTHLLQRVLPELWLLQCTKLYIFASKEKISLKQQCICCISRYVTKLDRILTLHWLKNIYAWLNFSQNWYNALHIFPLKQESTHSHTHIHTHAYKMRLHIINVTRLTPNARNFTSDLSWTYSSAILNHDRYSCHN